MARRTNPDAERSSRLPWRHAVAVIAVALAATDASAQESTALDRFEPAPAGDDFSVVPSAAVRGWLRAAFAAGVGYARAPLVVANRTGAPLREVVGHHVAGHALVSLSFLERGMLELDLPATLHQSGDAATPTTAAFAVPRSAALQDLRLSGRLELVEQEQFVPSIALSGSFHLPTGDRGAYAGTGNVRFTPRVTLSSDYGPMKWAFGVFRSFDPSVTRAGDLLRSEAGAEAALAGRIRWLEVGAEAVLATQIGDPTPYLQRSAIRFEPLATLRAHAGPVVISLVGGPGVARSPGTPAFRLYSSVGISFDLVHHSRGAGAADGKSDRSRETPASARGPLHPAPARAPAHAAPAPDRDGDGVPDRSDACPLVAGVPQPTVEKNGCPLDTDGDGFPDAIDACPLERGEDDADPTRRGCSKSVRVESERIVVLHNVQFATGRADLLPESDPVLEAVRGALESDPTIVRVAVDGHTDDVGAPGANLELSRARAIAVVRWLTQHGIDARRLTARGFGSRQPITDEHTDAGRAKNRRVELVILKRDPRGAAAWTDGSIETEEPRR